MQFSHCFPRTLIAEAGVQELQGHRPKGPGKLRTPREPRRKMCEQDRSTKGLCSQPNEQVVEVFGEETIVGDRDPCRRLYVDPLHHAPALGPFSYPMGEPFRWVDLFRFVTPSRFGGRIRHDSSFLDPEESRRPTLRRNGDMHARSSGVGVHNRCPLRSGLGNVDAEQNVQRSAR
jgi:hypothetical protein